jgi:hypothetical protein
MQDPTLEPTIAALEAEIASLKAQVAELEKKALTDQQFQRLRALLPQPPAG